jgi:hypothetical protein
MSTEHLLKVSILHRQDKDCTQAEFTDDLFALVLLAFTGSISTPSLFSLLPSSLFSKCLLHLFLASLNIRVMTPR